MGLPPMDWEVTMYVVEFHYRSDHGPRLVGPFATEQAGHRYVDDLHQRVLHKEGQWDASYDVLPLTVPPVV